MKHVAVLSLFIACALALTNIGTLTQITASGQFKGSLPPTPSAQAEYPIDYTIKIPLNAKNVAITVTADGSCSVNHNIRFHGLTCDQTEVTPYYLCSPSGYDYETTHTWNYPTDATIFRTNANIYLGVYRLVAGDEDCPFTVTVSYAYCPANQVALPGFSSVTCVDYTNATLGTFYSADSSAVDVLYRYVIPENTGSLFFTVASDSDIKFMGNTLAPINDQSINNDVYTCTKSISAGSSATYQCDVPIAGDFWFNVMGGGITHKTNFTISALQCTATTAGRNCSFPLVNLATLSGTFDGTVEPVQNDGYYPFAYFYLDSNVGDANGYALTFQGVGNIAIWTRKGGAPIFLPGCTSCSLYENWLNIETGVYYITPWDTWDGQRIYFGVSTDDLSPSFFSISIKPYTFPELAAVPSDDGSSGFAIAPQVALIVLFLALLF